MGCLKVLVFVVFPALAAIAFFFIQTAPPAASPSLNDGWWGTEEKSDKKPEDVSVRLFTVSVPNATLEDLLRRLNNVRLPMSLEGTNFEYGFHSTYMKTIINHWKTKYNWRENEATLNKFPQFLTKIEGIDVHFIRVQPTHSSDKVKRRPLLLIHGWPGSFWEFYKIIPLLTAGKDGISFEVICPSIPGYGYSEPPHRSGFNVADAARVFFMLMKRLGHDKFYVQGGDWGSAISTVMGEAYPSNVVGVHVNMAIPPSGSLLAIAKQIVGTFFPSLIYTESEAKLMLPASRVYGQLLKETGYMHIQATKPDTVAFGLNDSPVGLAAYILEKFSTWTTASNTDCSDGCLTNKFTADELLTNVMIYWTTGTIASSMRFYKETMASEEFHARSLIPVMVPVGIAAFPDELFPAVRSLVSIKYKNIVQFTDMPRGGHFAALEEPRLLSDDIFSFVNIVEQLVPV